MFLASHKCTRFVKQRLLTDTSEGLQSLKNENVLFRKWSFLKKREIRNYNLGLGQICRIQSYRLVPVGPGDGVMALLEC
jgi:hypothetical protein